MVTSNSLPRRPALSASRAKDFKQCPLMFRLRVIDGIPEPPAVATTKGTLVHAVLENLFTLPATSRTIDAAVEMLPTCWEKMEPRIDTTALFTSDYRLPDLMHEATELLHNYFGLENPQRLEPRAREEFVETQSKDGLLLRGFIDRIDVARSGAVRVVDYKTGKAPLPAYCEDALYQMKFYALLLYRTQGKLPARMQLLYLKDQKSLSLDPLLEQIEDFENGLAVLWEQIADAITQRSFIPRPTKLCPWCNFHALCPVRGGTPPVFPVEAAENYLRVKQG